jgi:hypothetical protein
MRKRTLRTGGSVPRQAFRVQIWFSGSCAYKCTFFLHVHCTDSRNCLSLLSHKNTQMRAHTRPLSGTCP